MKTIKKIRTAKFQSIVYNGKWGFSSSVPWLRLSGKWIEDAGFKIDETCQIKVSKNKLVITKIKSTINTNQNDTTNNNAPGKKNEAKSISGS
ncbi:Toxin SymE, type I toxin-antitoxin system [Chitinophaga sp. CF118]|uniref:SymE family type I addiction module toxin n=1 Tax=Chitinophaga sp. CF118 TaxID=1884367 RepID=UPI0008E925CC|nr:SymE family type I addiction module toxin [Chitinophaga sp. CF118]SFE98402.1 Toxin SymE, type I toxin-antitoxin system [Chitinophaga sp. CF118]